MKPLLLAAAVTAAGIIPATAQDAALAFPPAAPAAFNWNGAYAGAQLGYVWGKSTYYEPDYPRAYNFFYDPDGILAGAYAGYNLQMSNDVVFGAEIDVYGGNISGSSPYFVAGVPNPAITGDARINWAASVRARLGYAFDRFLPFISGGLALGNYSYSADDSGFGFNTSPTMAGWTIGAGVDYAVTDNVIARFEYRHTEFGSNEVGYGQTYGWYTNITDLKTDEVRLGIAYKF